MLGIDVSKDTLDAALIDPASKRIVWEMRISNTPEGVSKLLACAPSSAPWVLEPTGRYSLSVVQLARQAGRDVRMAPPLDARRYIDSRYPRASTDKLCARGLASLGLDRPLAAYPLKSQTVDRLDQLLAARRALCRAKEDLQARCRELPHAAPVLAASVQVLAQELARVDEQIAQTVKTTDELAVARRIDAIPGCGPTTSALLASRLVGKDFVRAEGFVSYAGLDVGVRQSGKSKGTRGLTKHGDPEMRRLAYLAAMAAVRTKGSPFTAQYQREQAKGLSRTAALCAVGRKILKVAWALHHHNASYDPAMVFLPSQERRDRQQEQAQQTKQVPPNPNRPSELAVGQPAPRSVA